VLPHGAYARPRSTQAIGCLPANGPTRGFESACSVDGLAAALFRRDCQNRLVTESSPASARFNGRHPPARSRKLVAAGWAALSSGAAKGFAHIGVIQVLEENGIDVDVVAGASMGAYVGSIWAHGSEGPNWSASLAKWKAAGRFGLDRSVFPPRQGFLRGYAVKKR